MEHLTLQVKKLEDRCGQLSRGKEELCQALTALKKGQSIAAGPGQTRVLNLMRRVHTLVSHSGPCDGDACTGVISWLTLDPLHDLLKTML